MLPKITTIENIRRYIEVVQDEINRWCIKTPSWYRGQTEKQNDEESLHLIPKVFTKKYNGRENELIQVFRMRAQNYGEVPEFSRIDQWLFLMQHCNLPTRLLDWSEGALIALYFSINRHDINLPDKHVVWLLNPMVLNLLTYKKMVFDLTWIGYKALYPVRSGNICAAFEIDNPSKGDSYSNYPTAIYPQPVHPRVLAQKGCFTVQGKDKRGLDSIFETVNIESILASCDIKELTKTVDDRINGKKEVFINQLIDQFNNGELLQKLIIDVDEIEKWIYELKTLGISHSTLFPDLDGLAYELSQMKSYIF